jgi:nitrogenase molybdenum-iron protein beta chain
MGVEYTLLTDLTALYQPIKKRVRVGTDVEDIRNSVNSRATICFGIEGISCAKTLENFGVPFFNIRFPIGIENTDRFVIKLSEITGLEITDEIIDYRGYAIDSIIDAIEVLRGKRVAIFGDPDKVIALSDFAFEIGLRVVAVLSSTKAKHFANEIERIAIENKTKIAVFEDSDLYQLHKFIRNNPVDLIIGDYRGRYIAVEEKIPLLRIGFPICDRFGYHRKPILGYGGAQRIAEEIANLLVSGCYG